MTPRHPEWWAFALLALAAFRVYRLIARDTITEPIRGATRSRYLKILLRCPWCAGFYVSVGWWAAWLLSSRWTILAATPWALSAVVALLEKNLDE